MGYEEILKKLDRSIYTDDVIDQLFDSLFAIGEKSKVFYLWRPYLKDPFDDHVLELALASESDYIVTYNKKTAILDREEFRCPQNTSNRDTIIWTQFRAGSGFQPLFGLPKVSYWKRYHSALPFDDAFNSLR